MQGEELEEAWDLGQGLGRRGHPTQGFSGWKELEGEAITLGLTTSASQHPEPARVQGYSEPPSLVASSGALPCKIGREHQEPGSLGTVPQAVWGSRPSSPGGSWCRGGFENQRQGLIRPQVFLRKEGWVWACGMGRLLWACLAWSRAHTRCPSLLRGRRSIPRGPQPKTSPTKDKQTPKAEET